MSFYEATSPVDGKPPGGRHLPPRPRCQRRTDMTRRRNRQQVRCGYLNTLIETTRPACFTTACTLQQKRVITRKSRGRRKFSETTRRSPTKSGMLVRRSQRRPERKHREDLGGSRAAGSIIHPEKGGGRNWSSEEPGAQQNQSPAPSPLSPSGQGHVTARTGLVGG